MTLPLAPPLAPIQPGHDHSDERRPPARRDDPRPRSHRCGGQPPARADRCRRRRIAAAIGAARGETAGTVYAQAWCQWERWCAARGIPALPGDPLALCAYLTERAEAGRATGTLDFSCTAIRHVHRMCGVDDPVATEAVRQVRRGLMRTYGAPPGRLARPLTVEEIRQIIGHIDRSTPIGIRDAAIILLGYASAMRRAEIVALTLADIEPKPAGLLAAMRNDSVVWARSLALVPNDDLQCPHGAELGNHPRATRISATRSARRWVTTRVPPKRLPAVGTGFGTRSERCRDVCGRQCARTLGFRVQ